MFISTMRNALIGAVLSSCPIAATAENDAFFTTFDTFPRAEWYISDFAIKRPSFRTAWSARNVVINPPAPLTLNLSPAPLGSGKTHRGAEVQRKQYTHYGRYEVVMTPARGEGLITAFFTYTGPYFDDPHDEIDFEFLGRDTTKVWVTRFADGERLPGEWIDLGFDAADAPHLYAFDWLEDRIVWYVDGVEIFRVEAADRTLPTTPGRVYLSIWGGGKGQANWSGVAPEGSNAQVTYECLSYVPAGETGPQCQDVFTPAND